MKVESAKQGKREIERQGDMSSLKVAQRVSFHRKKERKTSDNFSKSNDTISSSCKSRKENAVRRQEGKIKKIRGTESENARICGEFMRSRRVSPQCVIKDFAAHDK